MQVAHVAAMWQGIILKYAFVVVELQTIFCNSVQLGFIKIQKCNMLYKLCGSFVKGREKIGEYYILSEMKKNQVAHVVAMLQGIVLKYAFVVAEPQ